MNKNGVVILNKGFSAKKIFLLFFITIFILTGILNLTVKYSLKAKYHETVLSFEELIGDGSGVKDFDILDGNLFSLSEDPWISYTDEVINVCDVVIDVSYLSDNYTKSEIFLMYDDNTFDRYEFVLTLGKNHIEFERSYKDINEIRFDLLMDKDQTVGINSVELNDNEYVESIINDEIIDIYSVIFTMLIFVLSSVLFAVLGSKIDINENKVYSIVMKNYKPIIAILIFLTYVLCYSGGIAAVIPMALLFYYVGINSNIEHKLKGYERKFAYVLFAFIILFIYLLIPKIALNELILGIKAEDSIRLFIALMCCFVLSHITILIKCDVKKGNYNVSCKSLTDFVLSFVTIFVMMIAIETLPLLFFDNLSITSAVKSVLMSETYWLNILLTGLIFYFVKNLFGLILGIFFDVILFLFIFVGNFIKLKYHDTIFKPMDILQIGDFMGIATRYVPVYILYLLAAVIVCVVIYIFYKKRKTILKYKPNLYMAIMFVLMIWYTMGKIESNSFLSIGVDITQLWRGTRECVSAQGVICNSYIEFKNIIEVMPKSNENYSEEHMLELKNEFDNIGGGNVSDVNPDVILIMEESMFDVSKITDVNFSEDVTVNIHKYQKATTISPKYGGGTASVEFEALTGMSNLFFLDNIVPYVTYWNNSEEKIPGITEEFNNNGYETIAIHPNDGNAYNRSIVYECMRFDEFIDKDDIEFTSENVTDDGYFKDDALADLIDDELKKSDSPKFIFAITIENHTLYNSKYSETEVKLSSDKLNDNELHQLEQYSQGVYNADKFIEKMINIVDNAERPTIMYIWGDHLPALTAFNTLGFIDDKYNKYSTPLIAYSNYKDIEIGQEYITPNQIAPQILRDAEIEYSSYFDFIYSLREKYPVIQKEFGIDQNDELIKKYEEVQYDVLFGNQYLIEGE